MADLDSFFAKKDKRKVKGKKFTSTDEIARRLEETEKKLEKELLKETPVKKAVEEITPIEETDGVVKPAVVEVKPPKKEEEEWNDFEDKAVKDLTDLKISRLQIEDEEDGGGGGGRPMTEDGDEDGEGDDKKDGVWKTEKQPVPQPVPEEEPQVDEEPKPAANAATTIGGSYVPPHMRNVAPSPLPRGGGHRKSKTAPDITNEMAFPSLSDAQAANPAGAWGKKGKFDDRQGFENVRHGSSRAAHDDFTSAKLSTANRFDALTDHS